MAKKSWDDDISFEDEDFTLEDILAEFGSKSEKKPENQSKPESFDEKLFDEIHTENEAARAPIKKAASERVKKKQLNFPPVERAEEPQIKRKETRSAEEKKQVVHAHAVSAEKPTDKSQTVRMRTARLEDTLRLNELFESEEDYDEPEDDAYTPELPGDYVKRNAMHVRAIAIRSIFAFLLCLPACYHAFASTWGLPLPSFVAWESEPVMFLICSLGFHAVAILLHITLIWRGIKKLFCGKPDLYSMITVASLASIAHSVYMLVSPAARNTQPYGVVCVAMLFFAGWGLYKRESARLRACKAASASKKPRGIFISERDDEINLLKYRVEEIEPFTKYVQMIDGAERFWTYLTPILLIMALVFSGIASFGRGGFARFLWAFAAITNVSTPFFVLFCYSLPFSKITKRLSQLGAALAGWYAAFSLSGERNLVIRDEDLYPKGSVTLHGIKVFGNNSLEKAVSYATSMINEANSGLAPVFGELLKSQYGRCERVDHLLHHESGGMEADIRGDHILMGTASFMLRMGIRISEVVKGKNAMYLAINAKIAAVFNLNYKLPEDVKISLENIVRSRVTPVMASVDCNQSPVMVESEIRVRPGSLEYPEIEERLALASDDQYLEYDPSAFVTRSGLTPIVSAVLGARRLRKMTIRNVVLSTVCAIIGALLMFYITFVGSYESGAAYNIFLYLMLWTVPIFLLSRNSGMN